MLYAFLFYFLFGKSIKSIQKVVANENTSHLLLQYFNCSIRRVKSTEKRFVLYSDLGIQIHMSHSSSFNMQAPNPMKKKIIAAVVAVMIGHVGVFWAVSHMQTPELKVIEKKPLKIRFVKIVENVPPPPPPPVEPVKAKVQPKPEPKVEPPKPKPKVIAQKPQIIKEKVIHQDDTVDKKKLEQDRLEKERLLEKQRLEQQKREQDDKERMKREQDERERAKREQDERDRQRREQEEKSKPRVISEGEIEWSRKPRLSFTNKDLGDQTRSAEVVIDADANGNITNVKLAKSSGLPSLDDKILRAVRNAKFKTTRDGRPVRASLPFDLKPNG